jgi:hypothetical protein
MNELVASHAVESVGAIGDNIVRVRIARLSKGLEYMQQVTAGYSPEEGKYGACLLAKNKEPYAVGIYYLRGAFGFLMVPGEDAYARKIPSPNLTTFIQHVHTFFGYLLEGGTWNEQVDSFCTTKNT